MRTLARAFRVERGLRGIFNSLAGASGQDLADDLTEFADDFASYCVGIFAVGAGGNDKPVAGDDRTFVKSGDG